jgi:hypothetical protein
MNRASGVDPLLRGRIKEYIDQNDNLPVDQIYTNDVIDYLKEAYPRDYKRKTQFAMKNAVEKSSYSFFHFFLLSCF